MLTPRQQGFNIVSLTKRSTKKEGCEMPKTQEQNQEIKDERRANILKTALRLFAVHGYDSTTINDITQASNCSHGLFYHYFSSKEEVFKTLIEESSEREKISRSDFDFEGKNASPTEIMKAGLTLILDKLATPNSDFPYYLYMFLNIHFQKTLPEPKPKKRMGSNPFVTVSSLIQRGMDTGEFEKGDPKDYAVCLFSLLRGLTYIRIISPNEYRLPDVNTFMNLFLRKERP